MLKDVLRERIVDAMKGGRALERSILKVALGEIETAETRTGEDLPDAQAVTLVRKLVKSNEESLEATTDPEKRAKLEQEIAILDALLPKAMDVPAIIEALAPHVDAIRAAKADGPAIGIAMKHLKAAGAVVEGKDVGAAVRSVRTSGG
ncbi:MAG: GatB/YqeY domain-containing protein [Planctomycetota bacterium]|nr:GatB/YqeY domain-containing protein [Planctomycetota bacterium]